MACACNYFLIVSLQIKGLQAHVACAAAVPHHAAGQKLLNFYHPTVKDVFPFTHWREGTSRTSHYWPRRLNTWLWIPELPCLSLSFTIAAPILRCNNVHWNSLQ
eukprot:jgi/Botrbrau1/16301/Bobra.0066s0070.1